jgi:hypothetical protein
VHRCARVVVSEREGRAGGCLSFQRALARGARGHADGLAVTRDAGSARTSDGHTLRIRGAVVHRAVAAAEERPGRGDEAKAEASRATPNRVPTTHVLARIAANDRRQAFSALASPGAALAASPTAFADMPAACVPSLRARHTEGGQQATEDSSRQESEGAATGPVSCHRTGESVEATIVHANLLDHLQTAAVEARRQDGAESPSSVVVRLSGAYAAGHQCQACGRSW